LDRLRLPNAAGLGLDDPGPINKPTTPVFKVQEGILETDWMAYDVWMNLQFVQQGKKASVRRDGWPVAQIVPVRREGYDRRWRVIEGPLERDTPEGEAFYQRWLEYNRKKWTEKGRKQPYTYHSERARHLERSRHEP
jgi:antitoxin (DNA-binding transcriptional repressor) of toxin-antitoxin stability system